MIEKVKLREEDARELLNALSAKSHTEKQFQTLAIERQELLARLEEIDNTLKILLTSLRSNTSVVQTTISKLEKVYGQGYLNLSTLEFEPS